MQQKYYSGIKNKILPTVTCFDLEDIMLSEVSQIQKDKYCMISLICRIKNKQKNKNQKKPSLQKQNRLMAARGQGWEKQ